MTIQATVNGVSFASLGLAVQKHDIPVLPPTRDYNAEISGMDGEVDFGSDYGPRTISLECLLMADDATMDYQDKVAALAKMFNAKRGDLVYTFSDLPGKRYKARYAGTMPIEKVIFDGRVTIPLKMHDPYPEGDEHIVETTIASTPAVVEVESIGTVETPPVIVLTNTGVTTITGFTLKIEYPVE
ncbi:phage tail domain-containing protein [Paenibacillus cymbidii]|uniref:phage tail domain-containing protein n=1 Tax=Paenibacillus cymbidii TaxID=1639034 RepID=UPI00108210ED|nr:phage tail domain-containing protein [Paenibacillus cymbidii]